MKTILETLFKDILPQYIQNSLKGVGHFDKILNRKVPKSNIDRYLNLGQHDITASNKKSKTNNERNFEAFLDNFKHPHTKKYEAVNILNSQNAWRASDEKDYMSINDVVLNFFEIIVKDIIKAHIDTKNINIKKVLRSILLNILSNLNIDTKSATSKQNFSKLQKIDHLTFNRINKNFFNLTIDSNFITALITKIEYNHQKNINQKALLPFYNQTSDKIETLLDILSYATKRLKIPKDSMFFDEIRLSKNDYETNIPEKQDLTKYKLLITSDPTDKMLMSAFKHIESCQNLYNGIKREHLPSNLLDKNLAVAYLYKNQNAKDTGGKLHNRELFGRILLRLSADGKHIVAHNFYTTLSVDSDKMIEICQPYVKLPIQYGGEVSQISCLTIQPYLDKEVTFTNASINEVSPCTLPQNIKGFTLKAGHKHNPNELLPNTIKYLNPKEKKALLIQTTLPNQFENYRLILFSQKEKITEKIVTLKQNKQICQTFLSNLNQHIEELLNSE